MGWPLRGDRGAPERGREAAGGFAHASRFLDEFFRDVFSAMSLEDLQRDQYMGARGMTRLLAQLRWLEHRRGTPFTSILEPGCGHGHITRHLLAVAPRVLAFDFNPEAIAHAVAVTNRPDVFTLGDGLNPGTVTTGTFDLIVMVEFHPIYRPVLPEGATDGEYGAFFSELLRRYQELLTDDGVLYVQFSRVGAREWRPRSGRCSPLAGLAFVAPRILRPLLRLASAAVGLASRRSIVAAIVGKTDPT